MREREREIGRESEQGGERVSERRREREREKERERERVARASVFQCRRNAFIRAVHTESTKTIPDGATNYKQGVECKHNTIDAPPARYISNSNEQNRKANLGRCQPGVKRSDRH